jgi:hypothetical protein
MPARQREFPLLVHEFGFSSHMVRFSRTGAERTLVREHRKRRESHQVAEKAN